ncbi:MAG TPA: hypothetical protein VGQ99_16805 [Tepidisphaeraceae bacterium]|nr:hypothetical protein [Tepidisphaeraceae bacterium]
MRISATLFASLCALLAGCQSASPPPAGMASLRIRVVAEPKAGFTSPADRVMTYDAPAKRTNASGDFEPVDYSALKEIVVWIEPVSANSAKSLQSPSSIDIDARKPTTSLNLAASVGQQVTIRNTGSASGNLYSVSDGNDFNLGSLPPGGTATFTPHSEGLIEILNASLKEPVALVYAAPSPWVSLAKSGGTVDFTNLPPGQYRIISWHQRLPGSQTDITLSANQASTATIKVGVNALPKIGSR